ncbi:anti-sigma factor [Geodermatophilus ruber]|uniref:Anti-sigma-K factor rskA n=1 Tax=Geodermatophilus ruber TaxID=504800 RepID=A0A1I4K983_9ACTN|nr:anti-sigma factor [Geodermatophilus ruber]SFL75133.1 Anti-sigma-K factor rskA [Geodermatophilus ruber]
MQHCTPEQLALAALRELLPATDAAHLLACAQCRAEVASLQRSVDLLAVPQLAAPSTPVPPPPRVWDAIAAATGVTAAPRPEAPAAPAPLAAVPPAPVPARPRRSRLLLAAAAALVVGAGIGAGAVALGNRDDDGPAVAAAALAPLGDSGASGEARVVERADGSRVLELDLTAADLEDGYYEVWLLDEAVENLVSLGVVRGGGEVTLALPPGLDLGEYRVVDVSVEPLDGDPSHSGDSVARGVLDS